jgi:hypothetical protein
LEHHAPDITHGEVFQFKAPQFYVLEGMLDQIPGIGRGHTGKLALPAP